MAKVKADLTELNNLMKMLKKDYTLRIGIIGNKAKAEHNDDGITNATLGTFHEFGSDSGDHPPRRSFLEDPLKEKLNFNNEDMKPFKKIIWKQFFVKNAPDKFYMDLGAKALEVIESAFNTGGFGMWKPLSQSARRAWEKKKGILGWRTAKSIASFRKGLNLSLDREPLTDTGKMRKSISFRIIKK